MLGVKVSSPHGPFSTTGLPGPGCNRTEKKWGTSSARSEHRNLGLTSMAAVRELFWGLFLTWHPSPAHLASLSPGSGMKGRWDPVVLPELSTCGPPPPQNPQISMGAHSFSQGPRLAPSLPEPKLRRPLLICGSALCGFSDRHSALVQDH